MRDRVMRLERVAARDIRVNPKNWRAHNEGQRAAMRGIIDEVGFAGALLVRERTDDHNTYYELIDGELRRDLVGDDQVPVLVLNVDDAEADKLLMMADRIGAMAGVKPERLQALVASVVSEDAALRRELERAGAEARDLMRSIANEGEPSESVVDDEGQLDIMPSDELGVKPHEVWRVGDKAWIVCGDCRDDDTWNNLWQITGISDYDGVLTSPPYAGQRDKFYGGIDEADYVQWFGGVQKIIAEDLNSEHGSFFLNIAPHADEAGGKVMYVYDLVLTMVRKWGWRLVDELCWEKGGVPGKFVEKFKSSWEPVYHFTKAPRVDFHPWAVATITGAAGRPNVNAKKTHGPGFTAGYEKFEGLSLPGNVIHAGNAASGLTGHPAPYALGLCDFIVRAYSEVGGSFCDPFCGSGTLVLAAAEAGRVGVGIEIAPAYCEMALKRLAKRLGASPEKVGGR